MELTEKLTGQAKRISDYRGAQTAAVYSDPRTEFSALLSGCGIYDLGWEAKIVVTGKDRVRWLNGMITNNVRDLPAGRGVYAFLLNPQGHILGDLYAYNRGDSFLVTTDQGQVGKILAIFDRYIIMDDVEVTDISDKLTAVGVAGPKSRQVLEAAGFKVRSVETLELLASGWQHGDITMVRLDNPAVESHQLWLEPPNRKLLWEALANAGGVPVGWEALELLRIACGIPLYGQDIRERDLPQETEQVRAVHFNKGCYIGQEIVERIRSRGSVHRKFTGFVVEGTLPTPGTKIQVEGKDVGEITTSASLPTADGEYGVALGYIRREVGTLRRQLDVGTSKAIVNELPFAEVFKN